MAEYFLKASDPDLLYEFGEWYNSFEEAAEVLKRVVYNEFAMPSGNEVLEATLADLSPEFPRIDYAGYYYLVDGPYPDGTGMQNYDWEKDPDGMAQDVVSTKKRITRKKTAGKDYSNQSFAGVDFSGQDLSGANFEGSDLTGANLYNANLTNANLYWAYLVKANLYDANLTGADLTGAIFEGADLNYANLTGANLSGADLSGADLTGADLINANLTGANLIGAIFEGADLTGADLINAKLFKTLGDETTILPAGYKVDNGYVVEDANTTASRKKANSNTKTLDELEERPMFPAPETPDERDGLVDDFTVQVVNSARLNRFRRSVRAGVRRG